MLEQNDFSKMISKVYFKIDLSKRQDFDNVPKIEKNTSTTKFSFELALRLPLKKLTDKQGPKKKNENAQIILFSNNYFR